MTKSWKDRVLTLQAQNATHFTLSEVRELVAAASIPSKLSDVLGQTQKSAAERLKDAANYTKNLENVYTAKNRSNAPERPKNASNSNKTEKKDNRHYKRGCVRCARCAIYIYPYEFATKTKLNKAGGRLCLCGKVLRKRTRNGHYAQKIDRKRY